jgi:hypothetical protein
VIPATSFGAYITLLGMMVLSILFILGAGGAAALVVGTADIGLAKAVQQAARFIMMAAPNVDLGGDGGRGRSGAGV